jgi:hypothetical protein
VKPHRARKKTKKSRSKHPTWSAVDSHVQLEEQCRQPQLLGPRAAGTAAATLTGAHFPHIDPPDPPTVRSLVVSFRATSSFNRYAIQFCFCWIPSKIFFFKETVWTKATDVQKLFLCRVCKTVCSVSVFQKSNLSGFYNELATELHSKFLFVTGARKFYSQDLQKCFICAEFSKFFCYL